MIDNQKEVRNSNPRAITWRRNHLLFEPVEYRHSPKPRSDCREFVLCGKPEPNVGCPGCEGLRVRVMSHGADDRRECVRKIEWPRALPWRADQRVRFLCCIWLGTGIVHEGASLRSSNTARSRFL